MKLISSLIILCYMALFTLIGIVSKKQRIGEVPLQEPP